MRNNGWYIPYWRKVKRKGKAEKPGIQSAPDVNRSDEQLETVRRRWIERYRRTVRSLGLIGLSVGSNRGDVQARYNALREAGTVRSGELEDAYRYLLRVLPPLERRKRRPQPAEQTSGGTPVPAAVESGEISEIEVVATVEVYSEVVELEGDADEADDDLFAEDAEDEDGDQDAFDLQA